MGFADQASQRAREASRRALFTCGKAAVEYLQFVVGEPVQLIGGEYVRSAPGEPPFTEKGVIGGKDLYLIDSFRFKVFVLARGIQDLEVYTIDPKSIMLEYGTYNMEPRPFWFSTWSFLNQHIQKTYRLELMKELRRK